MPPTNAPARVPERQPEPTAGTPRPWPSEKPVRRFPIRVGGIIPT